MLQPIMENAVVHAFGDASRGYRITIRAYREEEKLFIRIKDNGKGMSGEELEKLSLTMERNAFAEENIGLVNVNQRIRPVSYTHLDVYKRQG